MLFPDPGSGIQPLFLKANYRASRVDELPSEVDSDSRRGEPYPAPRPQYILTRDQLPGPVRGPEWSPKGDPFLAPFRDPFSAPLAILAIMAILVHFGHIGHFGHYGPFWPFWSILAILVSMAILVHFGHFGYYGPKRSPFRPEWVGWASHGREG